MAYDKELVHTLLSGYARHNVLTLVYYLAQHDVDADIYADAARILQQAANDRDARRVHKRQNGRGLIKNLYF